MSHKCPTNMEVILLGEKRRDIKVLVWTMLLYLMRLVLVQMAFLSSVIAYFVIPALPSNY